METATLSAIILATVSIAGVIAKLIHSSRNDIKQCFCITFRTPVQSPHTEQITTIRPTIDTIVPLNNIQHGPIPTSDITIEILQDKINKLEKALEPKINVSNL